MAKPKFSDANLIKDIFQNMEYGSIQEDLDLAKAWLEENRTNITKSAEDIKNVVDKSQEQSKVWANISAEDRAKLLNRLALEVEKKSVLICQIELLVRQILTKDTKNKSINLLKDYFCYYANWSRRIEKEFPSYQPYGTCAAFLSESTPLAILGAVLAPILATGNVIILGVSSVLFPITYLIIELAKIAGFPDGTISVVAVPNIEVMLLQEHIKKIIYVGNLYHESIINTKINSDKDFTALHLGKSTAIIFENSDIDSSCDCIVDNAWSLRGMFPFGISKILVQESIFDDFISRIKSKILKLNVDYPENASEKTLDVIIGNKKYSDPIDIINKLPLQIGYKTFGKSVLSDHINDIVEILPFRTAKEAVDLANNSKVRLCTSIWTENISLANEVTSKLESKIIWINTHGFISASAAFSSGNCGYFGGKEGLLEYLTYKPSIEFEKATNLLKPVNNLQIFYGGSFKTTENVTGENMNDVRNHLKNVVEIAKKGFETWRKLKPKNRAQSLLKLTNFSDVVVKKHAKIVDKWIEYLNEWIVLCETNETLLQLGNPEVKIIKECRGIIVIDMFADSCFICLKYIISALIYGNVLILINYSTEMCEFLLNLCKLSTDITPGVLNYIFNPDSEIVCVLLNHREINCYLNYAKNNDLTLQQMQIIKHIKNIDNNSPKNVLNLITNNKCVCTSVGESFL